MAEHNIEHDLAGRLRRSIANEGYLHA